MTQLKVAIVGAGVAGSYCSYRLTHCPEQPYSSSLITLFEATDRIGGRLYSHFFDDVPGIPAELGGMYINSLDRHIYPLASKVLKMRLARITQAGHGFYYLRQHQLTTEDFVNGELPYTDIQPPYLNQPPAGILLNLLWQILPELKTFFPVTAENITGLQTLLSQSKVNDLLLSQQGFYNLACQFANSEVISILTHALGATTLMSNQNAADQIFNLLREMSGQYFKPLDGYQQLPEKLVQAFQQQGGNLATQHALSEIHLPDHDCPLFKLKFTIPNTGITTVYAEKLILGLPQNALKKVALYQNSQLINWPLCINAVSSARATKVFTTYPTPWWQQIKNGPGHVTENSQTESLTDLPANLIGYIGSQNFAENSPAVLMAAYADGSASSFWSGYLPSQRLYSCLGDADFPAGSEPLTPQPAPEPLLRELQIQLSKLHQYPVPPPAQHIFIDWAMAPYGGAWHSWNPCFDSSNISQQMLQPFAGQALYVAGESFAQIQGWAEGAAETAEQLMQSRFGLAAPDWL